MVDEGLGPFAEYGQFFFNFVRPVVSAIGPVATHIFPDSITHDIRSGPQNDHPAHVDLLIQAESLAGMTRQAVQDDPVVGAQTAATDETTKDVEGDGKFFFL